MNFICEDNSYRSMRAASDFSSILQGALAESTEYVWVERAELDRAEKELNLAGFGLIDRNETVRAGKWLNADWSVTGRIHTNVDTGLKLSIEVIRLSTASVLAETNLVRPPQEVRYFKPGREELANTTNALFRLLQAARAEEQAQRALPKVALLFLTAEETIPELQGLQEHFTASLRALAGGEYNFVQFRRAGESISESDLVLGGMAVDDSDAWKRIADCYAWGQVTVVSKSRFDRTNRQFVTEKSWRTELGALAGGEFRTIVFPVTNFPPMGEFAQTLAERMRPLLAPAKTLRDDESARRSIAALLVTNALALFSAREYGYVAENERARKAASLQMLETACFLAPLDANARENWTRERWSGMLPDDKNEFYFARRRSDAWGRQVKQFGFKSVNANPSGRNGIELEYLRSAFRPLDILHYAYDNQVAWGVPLDLGGEETCAWRRQFAAEFFDRLLITPEQPELAKWTTEFFYRAIEKDGGGFIVPSAVRRQQIIETLWPRVMRLRKDSGKPGQFDGAYRSPLRDHFRELGRPGAEVAMIKAYEEQQDGGQPPALAKNRVILPRAEP